MFGVPPLSRTYWRSLAQLDDSKEYRDALEREFPEGASELPDGITRRDMMMLLGASLSLAGLAGCRRPVEEIVPYVNAPEDTLPGIPRHYATTMPFRRSAYGLIVESHEGRPTKVEGNPAHPSTLGASSARIQASILGLYDPDRSQSVAQKGASKAWSDFAAAWKELAKAHDADDGAGLAVLTESFSSPTLARLASNLRERYSKMRWATYDAVSDENRLAGLRQVTGRDVDAMLRFDRAAVILALDADPLLTDPETIRHARGFADGRRAGASGGSMNRLYAIEGVYTLTGAMADHRLRLECRQIPAFVAALPWPGGRPGCRSEMDRRGREGSAGEPRQEPDRRGRSAAAGRARGGVRAQLASGQHRQDGHLSRNEGRLASERQLADRSRLRDESRHRPDARHPRGQSRFRRTSGPRLRGRNGEGASHDRARPLDGRDFREGRMAHSPRPLPRVVGRCALGGRHGEHRAAADPAALRREE
jgi:MoCo/4Fe-4S cofactor protein with predicted Tat translocation signal